MAYSTHQNMVVVADRRILSKVHRPLRGPLSTRREVRGQQDTFGGPQGNQKIIMEVGHLLGWAAANSHLRPQRGAYTTAAAAARTVAKFLEG